MKIFTELKNFAKENKKTLISVFIPAFIAAIASGAVYTTVLRLIYGSWSFSARVLYSPDSLIRMLFFFTLYAFIGSCFAFDRKKIFDYIFEHRWYFALGVFAAFVLLNINFSSVGAYDRYVQIGVRTDTTLPLFGVPRTIRSDEWLVNVPLNFTSEFAGFGEFNYIPRATQNYSISANGLKLGWSALCSPMSWGYYLFGAERGLSFAWSFLMVMTFMASYEFSLIISRGKRKPALLGAAFIGLSQFTLWWSVCTYLISAQMLIVCAYYFFGERKIGRKILFAVGAMFSATLFITKLYPAWQVPFGYVLIGLIAWLIITKFGEIKSLKWYDTLIIALAFALMCSFVIAFLLDTREANKTLLSTVYPGKRFDTGGGSLWKTGAFLHTLILPFKSANVLNNSEVANFFSLFPLPVIFAAYTAVKQFLNKRKDKSAKVDIFNIAVLIPALFLFVYTAFGIPDWLAKISFLSYSMGARASDFLSVACVYLMIRAAASEEKIPVRVFAPTAALCAAFWVYSTYRTLPGYIPIFCYIIIALVAAAFAFFVYCEAPVRICGRVLTSATAVIAILGICIHPIMHGADALVEKPFAVAVREEVQKNPDAKWIGHGGQVIGQYLIANGAPTINSTNYIPNLDFWHLFDPEGENEYIYNRYAHIAITFTDAPTSMELYYPDSAGLHINFGDIKLTGADYVASVSGEMEFELGKEELLEKYKIEFKLIYSENDACIYKVIYH